MPNFLLIGRSEGWLLRLKCALAPLGKAEIIPEEDPTEQITRYEGNAMIIIDAVVVADVLPLIARLRQQCPKSCIIVAMAAPTWQDARDVFQAGAIDCIRNSWSTRKQVDTIKDILDRSLPHEEKTP